MASPKLIAEINRTIEAYESLIGGFAASTHRMIESRGYLGALSCLVQSLDLQTGFRLMRDRGELDSTFESSAVRFSDEFEAPIVEAAQWRLDNAGELLS